MWNMIASADRSWGIGRENGLLVRIPADMQMFRKMTLGQIVVMGRKTLESLPHGSPLEGRSNVVLSADPLYLLKNGIVVHNIEELASYLQGRSQQIYVIGGASIYRQLLPYCGRAYITRIAHNYECDAYFPDLDADQEWTMVSRGPEQHCTDIAGGYYAKESRKRGVSFAFTVYERRC